MDVDIEKDGGALSSSTRLSTFRTPFDVPGVLIVGAPRYNDLVLTVIRHCDAATAPYGPGGAAIEL